MEGVRKPYQGVWNILRFNWHFYLISAVGILFLLILARFTDRNFGQWLYILSCIVFALTIVSLGISYYVYDLSGLYELKWLNGIPVAPHAQIININAGFDEISVLLEKKYPNATIAVCDFYDPVKHTEVSIERARKAYPAFDGTLSIKTYHIPFDDDFADIIFIIFSAHEIRKEEERQVFFIEVARILKAGGLIIVTEHLRDLPNFLAYNIGFFHFMSRASWMRVFRKAGLNISSEINITSFITTFVLTKNGTTA